MVKNMFFEKVDAHSGTTKLQSQFILFIAKKSLAEKHTKAMHYMTARHDHKIFMFAQKLRKQFIYMRNTEVYLYLLTSKHVVTIMCLSSIMC